MEITLDREKMRYLIDMKFLLNVCKKSPNSFTNGYHVGYFDAFIRVARDLDYISKNEYEFIVSAMFSVLQKR